MSLFNPRIIGKRIAAESPLPERHLTILANWAESIRSERIFRQTETALHAEFKQRIIVDVLGYRPFGSAAEWTVASEYPIGRGTVDLALGLFNGNARVVAPFELKGTDTRDLDALMPGRKKTPVQQAWEYAIDAPGTRWVLVSNYLELRLYAFGYGRQEFERWDLRSLVEPVEYARFMLLLAAPNLLNGGTEELLKESMEADREVTGQLYKEYKDLREALIDALRRENPGIAPLESILHAQTVLDRVLFIAFAEDTGLLPRRMLASAFEHRDPYNPHPVWNNFKGLFGAVDEGRPALNILRYNGGLFASDPAFDRLQLPDEICERFKRIGAYDFESEISVTILGHIFEQSISDVEALQATARGEEGAQERKSNRSAFGRRKREGIVYTPEYIARFIVERTIGAHLEEMFASAAADFTVSGDVDNYESLRFGQRRGTREWTNNEIRAWMVYQSALRTIRVVDPACGSGVFLVTAFDFLQAEYERVNKKLAELRGYRRQLVDVEQIDSEILSNNLYGVDFNAESVEITKLSLWLKTARRGKALDSLDHNIRVGDSVIEDANYSYRAFSWKAAFPEVFADGGFNVVLGNPPYVRMEHIKHLKPYLERRFEVVADRADLYCYFYERALKLMKPGGRLGFISSGSFFKTGSGAPLRRFLLANVCLETVVDFGDVRAFESVTTYPVIITMKRGCSPPEHEIRFWNLGERPQNDLSAEFDTHATSYPQSELSGDASWQFESAALRRVRGRIGAGKATLKEVYGPPLYGIKTGMNEAFIVDRATRDRLIAEDRRSAELLKPLTVGDDVERWHIERSDTWIIYIPKGRVDIEDFPAIKAHLLPFKERLERRATTQTWYELQQAQASCIEHYEKAKIIYPEMSQGRKFCIVRGAMYINNKAFFVPFEDYFLLSLLNSSAGWFFLAGICAALRGGEWRLELRAQYVEQFPVPQATDKQRSTLAALARGCQNAAYEGFERQEAVRRRIPDLCLSGRSPILSTRLRCWWTLPSFAAFRREVKKVFGADVPLGERSDWEDWIVMEKAEIERLSARIAQLEAEIDRLAYTLYNLTAEDAAIVAGAVSVTTRTFESRRISN